MKKQENSGKDYDKIWKNLREENYKPVQKSALVRKIIKKVKNLGVQVHKVIIA